MQPHPNRWPVMGYGTKCPRDLGEPSLFWNESIIIYFWTSHDGFALTLLTTTVSFLPFLFVLFPSPSLFPSLSLFPSYFSFLPFLFSFLPFLSLLPFFSFLPLLFLSPFFPAPSGFSSLPLLFPFTHRRYYIERLQSSMSRTRPSAALGSSPATVVEDQRLHSLQSLCALYPAYDVWTKYFKWVVDFMRYDS